MAVEKATYLRRIDCRVSLLFSLRCFLSRERGGRGEGKIRQMNWFRSKIRSCARLALLALAVQMMVSFGHMHPEDLGLSASSGAEQTHFTSATTHARQVLRIRTTILRRMITVRSAPVWLCLPRGFRHCRRCLSRRRRSVTLGRPTRWSRPDAAKITHSFQARGPPAA